MENLDLGKLPEHYGWVGVIILFLAQYGKVAWEKWITGEHVSSKELKEKITTMDLIVTDHLKKEALEDIMLAEIRKDQEHIRERQADLKEMLEKLEVHQQKQFDLISSIKDKLIDRS